MTTLIDISGYQDAKGPLDFGALQRAGVAGVIIKASEGTQGRSPYFARDAQAAHAAGLDVEAYHFTRPDATGPEAEAANFVSVVRTANVPISHLWDDAETGGSTGAASWGDWHARFCLASDGGHVTGPTGVYTAAWCAAFGSLNDQRLTSRDLWVAKYGGSAPGPIFGFSRVDLWQDRSNASYPGVVGPVDEDLVLYPPFIGGAIVPPSSAHPSNPIVASVVSPDGRWRVDLESNGGDWPQGPAPAFTWGGQPFVTAFPHLNRPVVDAALYKGGAALWVLTADGGVFPSDGAPGYGSGAARPHNRDAVRLVAQSDGSGYGIVYADGGFEPYGPNPPAVGSEA